MASKYPYNCTRHNHHYWWPCTDCQRERDEDVRLREREIDLLAEIRRELEWQRETPATPEENAAERRRAESQARADADRAFRQDVHRRVTVFDATGKVVPQRPQPCEPQASSTAVLDRKRPPPPPERGCLHTFLAVLLCITITLAIVGGIFGFSELISYLLEDGGL
jgi:hypothetical protein